MKKLILLALGGVAFVAIVKAINKPAIKGFNVYDNKKRYWYVECNCVCPPGHLGSSAAFYGTYAEAMDYCRHASDLNKCKCTTKSIINPESPVVSATLV
jgi:hypothetical protein